MNFIIEDSFLTGPDGFYLNVPFHEEYLELDAVSVSFLKKMETAPAEAIARGSSVNTRATSRGSGAHTRILENEFYESEYAAVTKCSALTVAKKPCKYWGSKRSDGLWYCRVHAPVATEDIIGLRQEDMDMIEFWAEEFSKLPQYDWEGHTEVSMKWTDPVTRFQCKGRIDFLSADGTTAYDLKTSREGHPSAFPYHMERWKYHRQQDFYVNGAQILGANLTDFSFIALGMDEYVSVHWLTDEVLAAARQENEELMRRLVTYKDSNHFPDTAYPATVLHDWAFPDWDFIDETSNNKDNG